MRPRFRVLLQFKVTEEMAARFSEMVENTGIDRAELGRQLLDFAMDNPPLLLARLDAQGKALREQSEAVTA